MSIESGQADVKFNVLQDIARILDVTVNDIISYDDKMVFNNCTNSHFGYNYNNISNSEKDLYEQLIQQQNKQIELLTDIIKTLKK